jgi:protocatechuate 3,4-dioxygenase beta subunit
MKIRPLLLPCLVLLCSAFCFAQTPAKEPSASVSGRVTIGGKGAPGITVVATKSLSVFESNTVAKATTDEDGNYKLTGLGTGRFTIVPQAKAFVVGAAGAYKQPGQSMNIAEGEAVTKIDFALWRGGVITGRITDAEGHPLIGERVSVALNGSPDASPQMTFFSGQRNQTDDRGIYRIYGLAPGSYKVSVGQAASEAGAVTVMGMGGSQYTKTFYPSVQDETKASLIEIKEGTEVANVDISVGKPGSGFSVSGRVVNADSGQPVPNIYIGHSSVDESNALGGMKFTGNQTDANGKFKLEGLRAGRYVVSTFSIGQQNSTYSEPAPFEITDSDVSGIEIKLRLGATIAGVAILENSSDPAATALLQTITLVTSVEAKGLASPSFANSQIAADGSFRFSGLGPGKARIWIQPFPAVPKGLTLVRTELEGLDQPEGVEVAAGANVTGVRLVFAYGTGSIRGEVKIEGGTLADGATLIIIVRNRPGDNQKFFRSGEVDARNRFVLENIPPGNYEVTLRMMLSDSDVPGDLPGKQTVTVANGAETQVTMVFDAKAKEGEPE